MTESRKNDLSFNSPGLLSFQHKPKLKVMTTADPVNLSVTTGDELVDASTELAERSLPDVDNSNSLAEVGDYTLLSQIGAGGMGVVYRARKRGMDFDVALKVLPEEFANDEGCKKRLKQEANAASKLTHVNLVTVFETCEKESSYIAMELIEGTSLAELLTKGALSTDQFHDIFGQVCDGLMHAHSKGVIHRDIKPANILIGSDGIVKIADFGIARTLEEFDNKTQTRLTGKHTVLGTPAYMSPEQCMGENLDERSDIYSLGAVMWQALTGRELFEGHNPIQVIAKHLHESVPSIRTINPAVPLPLEEVIQRCLQKDSSQRYQTAGEVLLALKHAGAKPQKPLPLQYRLSIRGKKAPMVALVVLGTVACLGLGSFIGLMIGNSKTPQVNHLPAHTPAVKGDVKPAWSSKKERASQADIAQWIIDLDSTKDPGEKVLYSRWIGKGYLDEAFPEYNSSSNLDQKRKALVLKASKYFKQALSIQLKLDNHDEVLDEIYDKLGDCARYLNCESDQLKYAQARCKLLEQPPLVPRESLVSSYSYLAGEMSTRNASESINAFRKAIYYDKLVNGNCIGDYALPAYTELIFQLESLGKKHEALDVLDEQIVREINRNGDSSPMLESLYKNKADLLDALNKHAAAAKVRERIKNLETFKEQAYRFGENFEDVVKRNELDLKNATDDVHRAYIIADTIRRFMGEIFPDDESWSKELDNKRKSLANRAMPWFQKYESLIPSAKPSRPKQVSFYTNFFNLKFALKQYNDALSLAQKRRKILEIPPVVLNEDLIKAYSDLVNLYIRTGTDPRTVDETCYKALDYNSKVHGSKIGPAGVDVYAMLADGYQVDGQDKDALYILDDGINRVKVTFGPHSKLLSSLLELKLRILNKTHDSRGAAAVTAEIAKLNKELTFEESRTNL